MFVPRRVIALTSLQALIFVFLTLVLTADSELPGLLTLSVLAVLSIISINLEVTSAILKATNLSVHFIFSAAAVVIFQPGHIFLGVALVGASGAMLFSHFRERQWEKLLSNSSNFGLSALAMAATYWVLPASFHDSLLGIAIGAVISGTVFSLVNWSLLGLALQLDGTERFRQVVKATPIELGQTLPFALLGIFLGKLYVELGVLVTVFFVVPMFIARAAYLSYVQLKNSQEATLRTLIAALESKDRYTAGHADRVATYAEYVGEEFGFGLKRMERLRFAALMHDIGKLIVPNRILNKPGRLTRDEYEEMKRHEEVSVHMLNRIDFLRPIAPAVTDHNRFGENENDAIEPYIIAAADAYDAMTSTRSYRKALSQEVAFQELRDYSGHQFHPKVVEALIHAIEKRGEKHGAGYESDIAHPHAPAEGLGSAGLGTFAPEEPAEKSQADVQGDLKGEENDDADVLPFDRKRAS